MDLKINHRLGIEKVDFFNDFEMELKFDSLASTFSFNYYFNPTNKKHAELSCVSHFHQAVVSHNGEQLIDGYILNQEFESGSVKSLVKIAGYAKPGILEDCCIPADKYPLQYDGLSIKQVAQKILAPFKLKMQIDPEVASKMNEAVTKIKAEPTEKIKDFLVKLTAQRDIVITHNNVGEVVFTKAKTNLKPIAHFENGTIGTKISLKFNGQPIHSHITVMKEASKDDNNAGQYTIKNPLCPIVYRPITITQTTGTTNTTKEAAQNALSAELKNIPIVIETDRWDLNGEIIKPNNIVTITDREIFLYKKTELFIESVKYTGNQKELKAVLTCVLPGVYNKETPKNPFVDPHQNLPRFT